MQDIHGVFANLPTAFKANGDSIDFGVMGERINWLVSSGVHGFSTQLSAGEFAYQSTDERLELTSKVLRQVDGRLPVLVGVSGNSTRETVHLAKHAAEHGATAVMVMPRSYFKLSEEEVLQLYRKVGEQVNSPLGVYNNPFTTGIDISADLYMKIQQVCDVAVTKDGAGDITRISELRSLGMTRMSYLCGTETQSFPSLVLGAHGCCNAINSVVPAPIVRMYGLIRAGHHSEAHTVFEQLQPLFRFVRRHGVARSTKAIGQLLNRSFGPHRAPLQELPLDALAELQATLDEIQQQLQL